MVMEKPKLDLEQKYLSAATCVRKKTVKLSKILVKYYAAEGDWVLDWGGGKYDTATEYLKEHGIVNVIYDPYNRSESENQIALAKVDYDFVMISNVLNVVAERDVRLVMLDDAKKHLKKDGTLLVKVWEGDGSGVLKANEKKNSCQMNQPIGFYASEIAAVFGMENTNIVKAEGCKIIEAIKR